MKYVRLPVCDEDGYMTSETMVIDVNFFLSSTKGLRSSLVELIDESEDEAEKLSDHFMNEQSKLGPKDQEELQRIERDLFTINSEVSKKEIENLDRIISGLKPINEYNIAPVWRTLENFPDYEIDQYQAIRDVKTQKMVLREPGGATGPRVILQKNKRPTMMNVGFLHKKAFPELHP